MQIKPVTYGKVSEYSKQLNAPLIYSMLEI